MIINKTIVQFAHIQEDTCRFVCEATENKHINQPAVIVSRPFKSPHCTQHTNTTTDHSPTLAQKLYLGERSRFYERIFEKPGTFPGNVPGFIHSHTRR